MNEAMINEKVISIEEFEEQRSSYYNIGGYRIITENQVIEFGMNTDQDCCESFGFFSTPDNIKEFINETLAKVVITETSGDEIVVDGETEYLDGGGILFVTLHFLKSPPLQFTAYNAHNGYYGHEAWFTSTQIIHSVIL